MRVLIAPDKFRGTATAVEAAEALAAGGPGGIAGTRVRPGGRGRRAGSTPRQADLVVTGEGILDEQSFSPGRRSATWQRWPRTRTSPGQALVHPPGGRVVDLVAMFGRDLAVGHTLSCLRAAVRDHVLTGADLARPRPV